MAEKKIVLQRRTAQVKIAVFETRRLGSSRIVRNFKRRRLRLAENTQLRDGNLYVTRRQLRIFRCTDAHRAARGDHIFAAQRHRLFKHRLVGVLIKGKLQNAAAVAQIHKNQLTEIALPLYPAEHRDLSSLVRSAEVAAIVRSFQALYCLCHVPQSSFLIPPHCRKAPPCPPVGDPATYCTAWYISCRPARPPRSHRSACSSSAPHRSQARCRRPRW